MEKIFQEFPETKTAKADYLIEIEKKRKILLEKELALKENEDQIEALKKAIGNNEHSEIEKSTSSATESGNPTKSNSEGESVLISLKQQELTEKRKALEQERLKAEQELVDYERRRSQAILGKIYIILRELAEESQVSVVVDKSHILYGTPQVDLTDKLRERLRIQ